MFNEKILYGRVNIVMKSCKTNFGNVPYFLITHAAINRIPSNPFIKRDDKYK